jgi:hypothetical protein
LTLTEFASDELGYVLGMDASARSGGAPVARDHNQGAPPDAGEELRHAAVRLDQLTSVSEFSLGGVERGWPADAAAALHEASRVSELLVELVSQATGPVLDNLDRGTLAVSSPPGGANSLNRSAHQRGMTETIAALLGEAAARLRDLSEQTANLQHTVCVGAGAGHEDGPTLAGEIVLQWRLPGMANESRFHVRVFRRSGEPPVVVIGELGDNHSQSITNTIGEVAAVVAEYLLGGGSDDSHQWVQLEPPGKFSDPDSVFGVIQAVTFEEPYGRPQWRRLTHEELEQLVGGPVRTWHVSNYTVARMAERGVPVMRPEATLHSPHPEPMPEI